MTRLLALVPSRIAGQITLLVLASVAGFQLVTLPLIYATGERIRAPNLSPPAMTDRFASFVRVLDRLAPEARGSAAAAMAESSPGLNLRVFAPGDTAAPRAGVEAPRTAGPGPAAPIGFEHLRRALGPGLVPVPLGEPVAAPPGPPRQAVMVRLADGAAATGVVPVLGPFPRPPGRIGLLATLGITVAFVVLILAALLWWATRGLTAPLARVAGAAEAFSLDRDPAPLPEDGPDEMRAVARALNRMQARVRSLVEDRTRMLAAVGHDLRTPITRMRLRAEFVEDPGIREPLLRDLAQMGAMVDAALSYLRGERTSGERTLVDVAVLLRTLVDDFADTGACVAYEGPGHLNARVSLSEIQRAAANLVENALKHGGGDALVRLLAPVGDEVTIEVLDRGPGIPGAGKVAMLEPFARGDAARGLDGPAAGFGLGLAIARAVAEAHGGGLTLHDREDGPGLLARLRLKVG